MSNENSLIKTLAAEKLKEVNPDAYEQCLQLTDAPLKDLRLLPAVLVELFTRYAPKPENSAFILAVVFSLYEPWAFHSKAIRSVIGIRQALCEAFKWNDRPVVNHYKQIMLAYYKGPRWAAKVREVASEVHQVIITNEADILTALGAEQSSTAADGLHKTSHFD